MEYVGPGSRAIFGSNSRNRAERIHARSVLAMGSADSTLPGAPLNTDENKAFGEYRSDACVQLNAKNRRLPKIMDPRISPPNSDPSSDWVQTCPTPF